MTTEGEAVGVPLMREHEVACERESLADEPRIVAALRESVDCIVQSVQAFSGLDGLEPHEQVVFTQMALGARSARVFVGLALTGHYESAMALARTLIEDGIACAYLAEHPEKAAKWLTGDIDPKYGEMAAAVIRAHGERDELAKPGEREEWRKAGEVLRSMRRILDDLSHANPARFPFVRTARGYQLYPFFDRDSLRLVAYFGLLGLFQMLFFTRRQLQHYERDLPTCNSPELRQRMIVAVDEIEAAIATDDASDRNRSPENGSVARKISSDATGTAAG